MRLVLTVEAGALSGRRFVLERGSLALGRDDSCEVRAEASEAQVSRRHAVITTAEDGFVLTDQGSTNGTRLDGQRIAAAPLASGHVIELGAGGPRLRVAITGSVPETVTDRAVPYGSGAADAAARAPAATLPPPGASASRWASGPEPAERPPAALRPGRVDRALDYDPARDKGRRYGTAGVALVAALMGLGGFLGLLVALLTAYELGLGLAILGAVVAFTPAPIYLGVWLWLDRYDPEPAWALAGCLVWGAGAATFVSSLFNSAFGAVVTSLTGNPALSSFLSASFSAPFIEEAMKGAAVLLVFLLLRREFDGVMDGILYAGVVALGFATVENVLYYGRVTAHQGASGLLAVFVLRGVLGPFAHAVFTSMTGIGLGLARQSHRAGVRILAPILGYGGAVFLHFLWNALAGLSGGAAGFLVVYSLVWVPLFLVFAAGVAYMSHRESQLIRRMLQPEVEVGLLTREQADTAASWPRRLRWLLSAVGDARRLGARRRFLLAAARLALSYWHVERASAAGAMTLSLSQVPIFRKEVARLQAEV